MGRPMNGVPTPSQQPASHLHVHRVALHYTDTFSSASAHPSSPMKQNPGYYRTCTRARTHGHSTLSLYICIHLLCASCVSHLSSHKTHTHPLEETYPHNRAHTPDARNQGRYTTHTHTHAYTHRHIRPDTAHYIALL